MDLRQFSNTGSGFGQGAYNRAKAAGLSDAQIRAGLKSSGLTTGGWAANKLGTSSGNSSSRSSSRSSAPAVNLKQYSNTGTGFGQGAYDRAIAAGLKPSQIKQALPGSGLRIGGAVGKTLGGNTSLYEHRGGGGQLGMGTYNKARAAGMTNEQIRSAAASSGLTIGGEAAKALNVNQGKTYLGIAPGKPASYKGNSGNLYPARPQLAPRGFGLNDPNLSSDLGYSPTFYSYGGTNDYDAMNTIFNQPAGTFNASNAGGGYSDPQFNEVNAQLPAQYSNAMRSQSVTVNPSPAPVAVNQANPTNETTKVGTNNNLKIGTKSKKGSGSSAFKRASQGVDRANTSLTI